MPEQRTVVVTGASRGLGRTMALDLARRGFTVFAGVRREEDGDALLADGGHNLHPMSLDVTSAESIQAAVALVSGERGKEGIHGLINNAALFQLGPLEQTSLSAVEDLFRVNVLGVVAMTQAFLPSLRRTRGRVVNISSVNGRLSFPFTAFYSASKFAVEALSDALRVELSPWGIEVSVVQPGATRTDIRAQGLVGWERSRQGLSRDEQKLYAQPFGSFQSLLPQLDGGAADHHHVTEAVYRALTDEPPATRYPAGPDAEQFIAMAAVPDRERDSQFKQMFGQAQAG
jgi:NAD(P)-dependent dehydrogenase (short-subunit alcohol dehydrogenase family)